MERLLSFLNPVIVYLVFFLHVIVFELVPKSFIKIKLRKKNKKEVMNDIQTVGILISAYQEYTKNKNILKIFSNCMKKEMES